MSRRRAGGEREEDEGRPVVARAGDAGACRCDGRARNSLKGAQGEREGKERGKEKEERGSLINREMERERKRKRE